MILGIRGKAGHGKDTTADYLIENYDIQKYNFADPMKRGAAELFGIPLEDFYDDKKKLKVNEFWGVSPVHILLSLGTEWGQFGFKADLRGYDNAPAWKWGRTIWIKRFEKAKLNGEIEGENFIFPDIRFRHEAIAIKEMGGKLVQVVRPTLINEGNDQRKHHSSETEMDSWEDWDAQIVNPGDMSPIEHFHYNIDNAVGGFFK
jgi:hypothetical protein